MKACLNLWDSSSLEFELIKIEAVIKKASLVFKSVPHFLL